MNIIDALKKLEGKTIIEANLVLHDEVGESLDLTFSDNSTAIIEGNMRDVNELKITYKE